MHAFFHFNYVRGGLFKACKDSASSKVRSMDLIVIIRI